MQTAKEVEQALRELAKSEKAAFLPKFFQAFPGGYGEGDMFLGVVVPDQRKVTRQFRELSRKEIAALIKSPWHECRLTGVFILTDQFQRNRDRDFRKELVDFLLENSEGINNWDIVDSCATRIIGVYVRETNDKRLLPKLARSKNLWEQRISIVGNLPLIKERDFDCILELSERLLTHEHDLIHKAVGWMLREMGIQDSNVLKSFLDMFGAKMPRTMLRYAIEKLPEKSRQIYLKMGMSEKTRGSGRSQSQINPNLRRR